MGILALPILRVVRTEGDVKSITQLPVHSEHRIKATYDNDDEEDTGDDLLCITQRMIPTYHQ